MNSTYTDERVLILAPVAHDAPAMAAVLKREQFDLQICQDVVEIAQHIKSGAGALLLTEEALESAQLPDLLQALERQPAWSELPLIVLTSGGESRLAKLLDLAAFAAGTVTLLERPISTRTLIRSVQVALRSRRRQYQARDLLKQLMSLNETLEQRVGERTAVAVERAEKLRILTVELSVAEERERRRIAEVLHDDLQQLLMAARMHFATFCKATGAANRNRTEQEIADMLERSFELTRSLSTELAPPILYEAGLAAALEWLAAQTQKKHGVPISVDADASADPEGADLRVFLFRAVRELLLNALKHAAGSAIHVGSARAGRNIRIVVRDEGPGFNHAVAQKQSAGSGGLGLFTIRERVSTFGGEFEIETAPGCGTRIIITVPRGFAAKRTYTANHKTGPLPKRRERRAGTTPKVRRRALAVP